jgi:hypothetical protein
MDKFRHVAADLQESKKVVFTAQSCRNFHQRMLICKFVFEQGAVPVNPFNLFGYYLYELVARDLVRNANNNLLSRCDELWIFGEISDGVLAEIRLFRKSGKPMRFFNISGLPETIKEIAKQELVFEDNIAQFRESALAELLGNSPGSGTGS